MDRFIYKYIYSNQNLKFKYTWALGKFVYSFNLCGLGSSATEIFADRQSTSSLILSSDLSVCLGFSWRWPQILISEGCTAKLSRAHTKLHRGLSFLLLLFVHFNSLGWKPYQPRGPAQPPLALCLAHLQDNILFWLMDICSTGQNILLPSWAAAKGTSPAAPQGTNFGGMRDIGALFPTSPVPTIHQEDCLRFHAFSSTCRQTTTA